MNWMTLRTALLSAALSLSCVTAPPTPCPACPPATAPSPAATEETPAQTLGRFLDASEAGRFDDAYGLLAAPLRGRYTPERLAQDFTAVPAQAKDRLARARAALKSPPRIEGSRAEFPISDSLAVRLVREGESWKVESLE